MKKIFIFLNFAIFSISHNINLNAQYCSAGSSLCDEYISNVQCGNINNTTTCSTGGYANYSTISTVVTIGSPQSISVTNGNYHNGDYIDVWIDLNQNNSFTDAGEQVVHIAQLSSFTSTYFVIPSVVLPCTTRMRICTQ